MTAAILVVNAGSSSLKFAVHPAAGDGPPMLRGKIAGIGSAPGFAARDAEGRPVAPDGLARIEPGAGFDTLIPRLLDWIANHQGGVRVVAAGHRVVHGGRAHAGPARITPELMAELDALSPLAPLHQPHNLAAVRAVAASAPDLPQVACFDTSFHRTQPRLAQLFALPRALTDAGILRYGFHGLSYDYIAGRLPEFLGARAEGRVIVAHLGAGASMCALRHRRSVAASMGFTALDGLMMGKRCGALDPGVILHLIEQRGMTAAEVGRMLYEESGLKGVSGLSGDLQVLETSEAPEAAEAIALFCWRAAGELAALAAAIEGLDALVFTAGIGENSARVRAAICARLGWMGVTLDETANAANNTRISPEGAAVDVLVIPTDEETVIARATRAFDGLAPGRAL